MKKKIVALAIVGTLSLATVATANWQGAGYGGYPNCPQAQGMYQQMDPATRDKVEKFFADNQALHKEMVMKRAEKRSLMRSANPDPKAVAAITGAIYDLHTTLYERAKAAGVEQYIGRGMMSMGQGPCGKWGGPGPHHKGQGMRGMGNMNGGCYNW
ncbi:periplasmic heavy metal sensor [Desulforhopalus singaporensis]|uniref:Heavy-metal resistance n=1 Tax=Desulforhopalus singaporensis TaxID=91360 RepID=A0A1H0UH02_9BACT|nr:periplasmic heavy metal sensor [Desulforhopalus singaporensis]SDP65360.1 Heavy-metal resistance [Desulforhopalus singaporensis]